MPLLSIAQPDGRGDLAAAEVLKNLEVLLGLRHSARPLQRPCQSELRRSVQVIDRQHLLKEADGLLVLLQILIADAFEVERIRIAGVELGSLLKAGQRCFRLIARMLRQSQVVPGLRARRIESDGLLQRLLGPFQLLQGKQRNALIDRRLRQPRVSLEGLGKALRSLFGELLAHQRHAAIVDPHRLSTRLRSCRNSNRQKNQGQHPHCLHQFFSLPMDHDLRADYTVYASRQNTRILNKVDPS